MRPIRGSPTRPPGGSRATGRRRSACAAPWCPVGRRHVCAATSRSRTATRRGGRGDGPWKGWRSPHDRPPGAATCAASRRSHLLACPGDRPAAAGRASRRFLGIALIDSVGTGLFLAGSALFFTRVLELSTVHVGIALSLSGMAGLLFSVPLGRFADRVGGRRVLLALYLYRGLGFLGYLMVHDFTTVLLVACLLGVGERATGPVVQALVGAMNEAESRVRTMAAVNAVRNIGFSIGTLLATAAIAAQSPTAFRGLVLANAVSFFLAAV